MAPQIVRLMLGTTDHRLLLPLCAVGGALFLLAADTLARTAIQPAELRVGIVTAFVGSPFFLVPTRSEARRAEQRSSSHALPLAYSRVRFVTSTAKS